MTLDELKIQSDETAELNAALSKAHAAFKPLGRTGQNNYAGYSYATITDINNATSEALSANGLSLTSQGVPVERMDKIKPYLVTTLWHDSGQWIRSIMEIPGFEPLKGNTQLQQDGSELTYLTKYGIRGLLGIFPEEDTDGADTESKKDAQPPTRKQPDKPPQKTQGKSNGNGGQSDAEKSVRAVANKLGIDLKEYFKVDSSKTVTPKQWLDTKTVLGDIKFEAIKAAAKMAIKFEQLVDYVNTSELAWSTAVEKFKAEDLTELKADINGFLAVGAETDGEPGEQELAGVGAGTESNRPE